MKHAAALSRALLTTTVLLAAGPASAITCKDGFQNVNGSWLSTPYCQDGYIAQVARQYGIKASAARVRENPFYKKEVCRIIGQDIRVKETCNEANPEHRGNY